MNESSQESLENPRAESKPIYFLEKNPEGWFKRSLPKIRQSTREVLEEASRNPLPEGNDWLKHLDNIGKDKVNKEWLDKSGVEKLSDINFSLIIPIHNEARFLPSVLGTLMMSSLPSGANINVIMVTNGCTDEGKSEGIVDNFMGEIGRVENQEFPEELLSQFPDPKVSRIFSFVRRDGIKFMHIDTPTPSKANALNIANTIAGEHGPLAICLDANNFIEPDAMVNMYESAHREIEESDSKTAFIITMPSVEFQKGKLREGKFPDRMISIAPPLIDLIQEDEAFMLGQFMAWNTNWVASVGGFPKVVMEDYAMGLEARTREEKVKIADEVNQWCYLPNTPADTIQGLSRIVVGVSQIRDLHPDRIAQIEKDYYFFKNLKGRAKTLLEHIRKNPEKTLHYLIAAGFLEAGRIQGNKDYKTQKNDQTWDPISSTK